ncbi:GAF domain-containing protein, partial [Frankia sp. CcWB2]
MLMTLTLAIPSRMQTVLPRALARLRASSGAHITFGGMVALHSRTLTITNVDGPGPAGLIGVEIPAGMGIGGQVVKHCRPVVINDRAAARRSLRSTAAEIDDTGLGAIMAVPVCEDGAVAAVLYAALEPDLSFDESAIHAAMAVARLMERELGLVSGGPRSRVPSVPV